MMDNSTAETMRNDWVQTNELKTSAIIEDCVNPRTETTISVKEITCCTSDIE